MLLKILISCFVVVLFANANDISILSKTKRSIIENQKKQNKNSSGILKYDWINPITASFSRTISTATSPETKTDNFSIAFNQPIFKSGGIYYALQYAKANKVFLKTSILSEEKDLTMNVYSLVVQIRNIDLQIMKQKYLIKNANIDIERKKEQYLSGILDSSYLNNAILQKNSLSIALLDMKSSKIDLLRSLKNITNINYKNIKIPRLKLIRLNEYLKNNILIQSAEADKKQQKYLEKMTISSYLPTISLFANYNSDKVDFLTNQKDTYKNYGITISMPLYDINRKKKIELQRLKYLKSKLDIADKKNQQSELFNSIVKKLNIIKRKIKLSKEQEKVYFSLLNRTKDLYHAGEKTIYDVQTMQNSLNSTKIDKEIYKNEEKILLLKLYKQIGS